MDEFAVLRQTIEVLRWQHIWPRKGRDQFFYFRYLFTYIGSAFALYGVFFTHVYSVLKDEKDVPLYDDLADIMALICFNLLNVVTATKQKTFAKILTGLSDFESFGTPDDFEELNGKLDKYARLFSIYNLVGLTMYGGTRYLFDSECRRLNDEKGYNEICGCLSPMWLPFNIDFFPLRQIVAVTELVLIIFPMRSAAMISFAAYELSQHFALRLKHLRRLVIEALRMTSKGEQRKSFNNCIRYHQFIMRIHENFDSFYKMVMSDFMLMGTIMSALIANQILVRFELGPCMFLAGLGVALFIVCYAGQTIISESIQVADTAYESDWYNASVSLQKDVMFLMKRAQKPLCMHASPNGVMCLPLFISLLKTSYSYLTLVNQSM